MLIQRIYDLYNEYCKHNKCAPDHLYMDHQTKYDFYNECHKKMNTEFMCNYDVRNTHKFWGMKIRTVNIYSDIYLNYLSVTDETITSKADNNNYKYDILKEIYLAKQEYINNYNKNPKIIYVNRLVSLILMRQLDLINDPKYKTVKLDGMYMIVEDLVFKGGQQVDFVIG